MSKIIGVTVGTTINPDAVAEKLKPVKTVNGIEPDSRGNVEIEAGLSPTVGIEKINGGYRVTVTDVNGSKYFTVMDGEDGYTPVKGKDYFDGKDGTSVTVSSVTESTGDGGVNVVAFSDGNKLNVRNGKTGSPGYTPQKGIDYFDGAPGAPGYTPQKGIDYFDGAPGSPGYTPQKGTDYFTEADKQELVAAVLAALPRAEEADF